MPHKVVITGTTGQLGSYLLDQLLQDSSVDTVWCLNRSANCAQRQAELSKARGLECDVAPSARVSYHQCVFSAQNLGLPPSVYTTITSNVTHILHCAWPVDWNRSFESFEPSIRAVAQLIDLASTASHSPLLFFLSSIASVGNWGAIPGARDSVPEAEVDDWKVARLGYGQAKLVAERLLGEASRKRGIKVGICRIGQVAGPVRRGLKGTWPEQEWIPSLIKSANFLGCIPKMLGPAELVDWIPVDWVSQVVAELLFTEHPTHAALYHHVRNPVRSSWAQLVPVVAKVLNAGRRVSLEEVDLSEWVQKLEATAVDPDLDGNPAVKLLSFFQNVRSKSIRMPNARAVILEVKNTSQRSVSLRRLQGVHEAWMLLWMQQWGLA